MGRCLWCLKCNLFTALELVNLSAPRFRSKAFSSACLFRPSIMTQAQWGEGKGVGIIVTLVIEVDLELGMPALNQRVSGQAGICSLEFNLSRCDPE
jgi:hypothetical protein